jgi:hypothetical protein
MSELKTKPNDASVEEFLNSVEDEKKRKDAFEILNLMKAATGDEPKMWGGSMIGFGDYHYKYASGREGDWFKTGFSPRKQNLTLYMMCDISKLQGYLDKLGKHKIGKGCLYIKKLEDVNIDVLKEMIEAAAKESHS